MEYQGRYTAFDPSGIGTYPLAARSNKVKLGDLVRPKDVEGLSLDVPQEVRRDTRAVAEAIVAARRRNQPVILFTGAHLIKNGLGPLLLDLVERGCVTLVAGNGATTIHDFELALVGETSENVPAALDKGLFGMAYEFAYINTALSVGNEQKLGYGESLGRTICDEQFRRQVLSRAAEKGRSGDSVDARMRRSVEADKIVRPSDLLNFSPSCPDLASSAAEGVSPTEFSHPEVSVLAACYRQGVPFTVHVGIGTDVIDQHPSFDGQAKGGCSGRDFLLYTNEVAKLTEGGVVLNIGSAVTGPEVLLKAVSMAANVGRVPHGILTADFDLRMHEPRQMRDEAAPCYYFRDQKSVVTRIPEAFGGRGLYIQGDQKQTFPLLYKKVTESL
ncbi:MAG: hypothetical protein KBE65_23330 [Phycisphaerae bacterium]|nr:hypothetical protein [Phycisphaerae bacterium]